VDDKPGLRRRPGFFVAAVQFVVEIGNRMFHAGSKPRHEG
jgi:hypothetical protein